MNGEKKFLTFPRTPFVSLTSATAVTIEMPCLRDVLQSCLVSTGSTEGKVVFAVQCCLVVVLIKKKKHSTVLNDKRKIPEFQQLSLFTCKCQILLLLSVQLKESLNERNS